MEMDTKDKLTAMYLSYTGYALFVVIGLYCVYLSWSINTLYQTGLLLKLFYAVCAYFGNVGYLIFYYVYYILQQNKYQFENFGGEDYIQVPFNATAAQLNRISTGTL